jgi:hypothetical protein
MATKTRKSPAAKATKTERGPRAETVAAAKRVVSLRDQKKMSWSAIQSEIGCSPSQLRRLYSLGGGKADGARYGETTKPKAKATRSRATKPKARPKARRASRKAA